MSGDEIAMRSGGATFDDQVFERLLRERIIFLGSEVNDEVTNRICAQLLLLASDDSERDIALYINSPGGSITAGMAASMGQFLLCAGAPGKRYALPHARVMMHQLSGGIGGTAADIAIQAESMLHIKTVMNERIAFHSGHTAEEIGRDSDRDRWFTAQQAKEYGIIDHVISKATDVRATSALV